MLLYFNPGHETAVLNASPYYMPPASVLTLQHDLAFLPAWYGKAEDCVLVSNLDTCSSYYKFLQDHFPTLPAPVDTLPAGQPSVSLWGISPHAIHFFHELAGKTVAKPTLPAWHAAYGYLNSRTAARDCLAGLLGNLPTFPHELLPTVCHSVDEVKKLVRESDRALLAKTPYSSSGRGLLWLPLHELSDKTCELLHGMLKKQHSVYVEKVWDKVIDFSMQFMCDGNGNTIFTGYSLFQTNEKGAYTGNLLYSQQKINAILTEKISSECLKSVKRQLISFFNAKCAGFYCGCVGVDMLIYREKGEYKLHPCLEINLRYNMGYLSLRLQQNYLADAAEGSFVLDFHANGNDTLRNHIDLQRQHPLLMENGRIVHGYLSLCPVSERTRYRAYVLVAPEPKRDIENNNNFPTLNTTTV